MAKCAVCTHPVDQWVPHPHILQRSEFMRLMQAVGSDLSVYGCPVCGCNDRDRHLWLYMKAVGIFDELPKLNVLHIAPEEHLEILIDHMQPKQYIRGDLFPKREKHQKINVEDLPFSDGQFNLIICNHVLEHVSDPHKAIAEFYRCLAPEGILVAQTPYSPAIKYTLEMNAPVSAEFAKLFFGQDDHVRLFGSDIEDYFNAAGFKGSLLESELVLPGVTTAEFGININEPFFVFAK
jgi:SAM-dependent methyltransferase